MYKYNNYHNGIKFRAQNKDLKLLSEKVTTVNGSSIEKWPVWTTSLSSDKLLQKMPKVWNYGIYRIQNNHQPVAIISPSNQSKLR